jgi:hypothetical protein
MVISIINCGINGSARIYFFSGDFMSYQLRDEDVVWDAISPTNVVIADLQNGRYSTLLGDGAEFFWNLLIEQTSLPIIVTICKEQFSQFDDKAKENINHVIEQLHSAEIIVSANPKATKPIHSQHVVVTPFSIQLTQYDDMELLLKLDPIDQLIED